jgi:hypothetical protein
VRVKGLKNSLQKAVQDIIDNLLNNKLKSSFGDKDEKGEMDVVKSMKDTLIS